MQRGALGGVGNTDLGEQAHPALLARERLRPLCAQRGADHVEHLHVPAQLRDLETLRRHLARSGRVVRGEECGAGSGE